MALKGAGRREHTLKLHAGKDVGIASETELTLDFGSEFLEAGGKNHGADFKVGDFLLLLVVYSVGFAEFLTHAARAIQ